MNFTKLNLIIFILGLSFLAVAQKTDSNEWLSKKNAVSVNLLGTSPILGVNYERILNDKLSMEFGVGLFSLGMGMKFYPAKIRKNKLNFHIGYTNVFLVVPDYSFNVHYVPIGLSFFEKMDLLLDWI